MLEHIELFFKSIFIDNMVFATFLGMCSYLAVSKKVTTAVGLGAAVIFVLAVTVPLNWLLDQYILQDGALSWLGPEYADYDLSFLIFYFIHRNHRYHGTVGGNSCREILPFFVQFLGNFLTSNCGKLCDSWRILIYAI